MNWKLVAAVTLALWLSGCWAVSEFMCKYTPDAGRIPAQIIEGSWFTRKEAHEETLSPTTRAKDQDAVQ